MHRILKLTVLSLFVLSAVARAADDPLARTWKLNVAKSKFDPGPAPQALTNKYDAAGQNTLKLTQDGVDAKGDKTHAEDTIVFDGKELPMKNFPIADAQMNRRVDANTTERTRTKGGKLVNYLIRSISPDGKTMTMKQIGFNAEGKAFSNIEIFEKQ